MMRFFSINTSFHNRKQLTARCEAIGNDYDLDASYSYRKRKFRKMIDFEMKLPNLIVNEKISPPTDNTVATPLRPDFKVFSLKVNAVLEILEMPDTLQIFDIKLEYQNTYLDYIACHFAIGSDEECINFKHSKFRYQDKIIELQSFLELLKTQEEGRKTGDWIYGNKLVINKNFKYDFFKLNRFSGYYCSERFVNIVNDQNLTGFSFEEIDVA